MRDREPRRSAVHAFGRPGYRRYPLKPPVPGRETIPSGALSFVSGARGAGRLLRATPPSALDRRYGRISITFI